MDKQDAEIRNRNTSTDVEKTHRAFERQSRQQKHLHGRGEDSKI